jgi:hypothetical protein
VIQSKALAAAEPLTIADGQKITVAEAIAERK